jgi:hypothetical protein
VVPYRLIEGLHSAGANARPSVKAFTFESFLNWRLLDGKWIESAFLKADDGWWEIQGW